MDAIIKNFMKKAYKRNNLIILLVGILLTAIGYLANPTKLMDGKYVVNGDLKNLLMSVGCSIIASSIIVYITQGYIERKDNTYDMIQKWQLISIFATREESNALSIDKKFKSLNKELEIIAFGLDHFRTSKSKLLEEKIKKYNNLQVKIITMNPDSQFVSQREKDENRTEGSLKKAIADLIKWVEKVNKNVRREAIQIKYYDALPLNSYLRIDETIFVGPYEYGKMSSQSITFEFEIGGDGYKYYKDLFKDMWENTDLCKDKLDIFPKNVSKCTYPGRDSTCSKFYDDGIIDYFTSYTDINGLDVKEHIRNAKSVKFIEIYSARNIKENFNALKEMINNGGKLSVVILDTSNTSSEPYKYLNNKFMIGNSLSNGQLQKDQNFIDNSTLLSELNRLKDSVGDYKSSIEVFFTDYIPQYSAILIDNVAYVIFYQTSPGRNTDIPAFKIIKEDHSKFYEFISKDFDNLINNYKKM